MRIIENFLKKFLPKGTIIQKEKLSPAVYTIRIKSDAVKTLDFIPGYFLRLGVGIGKEEIAFKDKVRSYSIWDIDKKKETIAIAIATHSQGIGAKWAETCKLGDAVHFKWKKGKFLLDKSADSYLMIGDLSALSHLYMIKRNLPSEKQVASIIYSQDINELFADVAETKPFEFYEMAQNPYKDIISKIPDLLSKMQGKKMVYLAGDSRVCVALNKYFRKELNWQTKQIKTKPFWNPDKKGLE